MKKQAKLYKEYQGWVKKKNAKVARRYKVWVKDWEQDQKKEKLIYKKRLTKWQKKKDLREIKRELWENRPFFCKLFSSNPYNRDYRYWLTKPQDYSLYSFPFSFFYLFPGEAESMEGFYDWLVKVKYKGVK